MMPSTVRLSKTELVTTVRHEDSLRKGPNWIDAYASRDDGKTWQYLGRPVPDTGDHGGNPPSMVRLRDGRFAITYGHRSGPFEVRGRISSDGGKTWGAEILRRGGAGAWDIGYTRTVQRPDGKLLTAYCWTTEPMRSVRSRLRSGIRVARLDKTHHFAEEFGTAFAIASPVARRTPSGPAPPADGIWSSHHG
jgi:hypothetical protein